ncbi:hypothetical protein [Aureimonas sp. N4]|uniref:hypothetical protein n=1 Tax=Aureimonas sp. N4 TaxID=1638165 RepID=UPI0012E345D7|nr:hypothetical protein [Aureimonas sp. N4]
MPDLPTYDVPRVTFRKILFAYELYVTTRTFWKNERERRISRIYGYGRRLRKAGRRGVEKRLEVIGSICKTSEDEKSKLFAHRSELETAALGFRIPGVASVQLGLMTLLAVRLMIDDKETAEAHPNVAAAIKAIEDLT